MGIHGPRYLTAASPVPVIPSDAREPIPFYDECRPEAGR